MMSCGGEVAAPTLLLMLGWKNNTRSSSLLLFCLILCIVADMEGMTLATAAITITTTTTTYDDDDDDDDDVLRHLIETEGNETSQQEQDHQQQQDDNGTHITMSFPLSVAAISLGSIASTFIIGAWIFVYCFRKKKVVSLGQPPFLYLICAGSLLVSSSLLFEAGIAKRIEDVANVSFDSICIVKLWFLNIGFIIVYMSLFCKLWRAEQVCQFRRGQTIHVRHVIGPFFLMLLIQIGILIGHTIVSPPYWSKDIPVYPHNPDNPARIENCYQYQLHDATNMAFNAASLVVLIICEVITMWMSYKTRKIQEDISDSWRVFQTMCFQFIISIPFALFLHGLIPAGRIYYVFEIGYPFLIAISSVGFLIVPKMYYVHYEQKNGHLPDYVRTVGGGGGVVVAAAAVTGVNANATAATATATAAAASSNASARRRWKNTNNNNTNNNNNSNYQESGSKDKYNKKESSDDPTQQQQPAKQ